MSSFEPPSGTFPLVFESGVINLDESGVLHVHLTHSPENPHPMLTHPDGEETTIPAEASEVYLDGIEGGKINIRGGIREADTLPSGFVFHIVGWRLLQLEMSGDLTVVMGEMQQIPSWFQDEKVHRFDGPDEGVRLYKDSRSLSEDINIRMAKTDSNQAPPPSNVSKKAQEHSTKTQDSSTEKKKTHQASNSGCGLLVFLLGMALFFGAAVPILT
ncbi:MAG: hypothetical protein VX278_13955 [Myxococcota bacterium]|nr:hypothetical protein [Myxococcota bacterium]